MTAQPDLPLILFLDDEELILEMAKEALEEGGFSVRPAHTRNRQWLNLRK
jgi:CheY-like chemotaxis protein